MTKGSNGTGTSNGTAATNGKDRAYDAIVIGAGHNGMVNASYLAKAGLIIGVNSLVDGVRSTGALRLERGQPLLIPLALLEQTVERVQ